MKSFPQSMWLGLLAACPLLAAAQQPQPSWLPNTVDWNVIFPRNNTAYKPMHPFPLVFASRNRDIVSYSTFNWEWSVASADSPSEVLAANSHSSSGAIPNDDIGTGQVQLYIQTVRELQNSTAKDFILTTGFGISDACDLEVTAWNLSQSFSNTIYFSFDADQGEEPKILTDGTCASSIGAIGVQKEIPRQHANENDCLVLESGPPWKVMDECLKADNDMADNAAVQFTAQRGGAPTGCDNQTWPDVNFIRGKCNPQSSGSGRGSAVWVGDMLLVLLSISAVLLGM